MMPAKDSEMANDARMERLRLEAEAALAKRGGQGAFSEVVSMDEHLKQMHVLDVYRAELEMQNEELRRTQLELEETRDSYADLFDFAPVGYFTLSENLRIQNVNLAGAMLLTASLSDLLMRPLSAFVIGPDLATIRRHVSEAIATGNRQACEIGLTCTGGKRIFARLESVAVPAALGSDRLVRTAIIDITERRLADEALRTLSLAVEQSPAAVIITEPTGSITYANRRFVEMTGYSLEELIGMNPRILKSGQTTDMEYKELWDAVSSGRQWCGALLDKRKDGTHYWVRSHISPVMDASGKVTHLLAIQEDITLEKIRVAGMERQATYDYLTGLPNRLLAFDRLEHALARMARERIQIAVLVLDLDNFKQINDTLGHLAGDQLLVQVGVRLTALLRAEDTVARLGGDEFMVILPSIRNARDAELIAAKIIDAFTVPFVLLPQELFCTISIGISVAPDDGVEPYDLFRNADTALYVAKAEGRNTHRYFIEHMNRRAKDRMGMVTCLRQALGRGELFLVYQPLVDIASGSVTGAEALMRWHSPELGPVDPSRFIPLAEELGLIVPFGHWLLESVCQQIRNWQAVGLSVPRIAVNISSRQLRDAEFSSQVIKHLTDNFLHVGQIVIEITESILIGDCIQTAENMRCLREAGIIFSIDDFGTGYSSLSYLQRFCPHSLKIDRSFITNLPDSVDAAILTRAIISLAQQLRMTVVAEGVETFDQLQFLRHAGCDIAQGYFFSRPVPPERLAETIATIERGPAKHSTHRPSAVHFTA